MTRYDKIRLVIYHKIIRSSNVILRCPLGRSWPGTPRQIHSVWGHIELPIQLTLICNMSFGILEKLFKKSSVQTYASVAVTPSAKSSLSFCCLGTPLAKTNISATTVRHTWTFQKAYHTVSKGCQFTSVGRCWYVIMIMYQPRRKNMSYLKETIKLLIQSEI